MNRGRCGHGRDSHLAHEVDTRYWECKEEIQCTSKQQTPPSSNKLSSGNHSNTHNPSSSKARQDNKAKSGSPSTSNTLLSKPSSSTTPVNSKLGKDGKLTL